MYCVDLISERALCLAARRWTISAIVCFCALFAFALQYELLLSEVTEYFVAKLSRIFVSELLILHESTVDCFSSLPYVHVILLSLANF